MPQGVAEKMQILDHNLKAYSKRSIITCQGQKKKHLGQIMLRYQRYQERILWQSQSMGKRIRSYSAI